MYLEHIIEEYLPLIIVPLEMMGIIVILVTSFKAFYIYLKGILSRKIPDHTIKTHFAKGLGMALEFLLAGEILKTILIRSTKELLILGIIMGLRIIVTFLLHWELKNEEAHKEVHNK